MASDELAAVNAELARRESLAAIESELSARAIAPKSELRAATPTSWGVADPIRKGLYAVTGDEMFDDMKGVPIQENWNNGNLEGYSYGGGLRNSLATGTEVAGNVAGALGAGAIPGVGWLGIGTGATTGDLTARALNRYLGLRPLEDVNTGEKEGIVDPYLKLNPLENPAALNLGIPIVGKALGTSKNLLANSSNKLRDKAFGIEARDKLSVTTKKPNLLPGDAEAAEQSGLFKDAKNFEDLAAISKDRKSQLGGDLDSIIQKAEETRLSNGGQKIAVEYPEAEAFVQSSSPAVREDLEKELADLKDKFDRLLTGEVTDLQKHKVSTASIAHKQNKKDPDLLMAFSSDLKNAVESAAGDTISNTNQEYGLMKRLDKVFKRNVLSEDKANKDQVNKATKAAFLTALGSGAGYGALGPFGTLVGPAIPFIANSLTTPSARLLRSKIARNLSSSLDRPSAIVGALEDPTSTRKLFGMQYPAGSNNAEGEISISPAILRALIASAQKSNDNEGQ